MDQNVRPAPAELPAPPGATPLTAVPPAQPAFGGPSGFSPGPWAAGLLLAALAAAAVVLARRRRREPRLIEILESARLGPKRSLVLARLGDEVVLIGSSEGGVSLLSSRSAAGLVPAPAREARGVSGPPPAPAEAAGRGLRFLKELFPRRRAAESPAFENYLSESVEDLELRRKLAAGQAGHVP